MTHNDNTNCLARPNLTRIRRNPTTLANSPVTMDSDPTAITIAASPLFKLPAELRLQIYGYAQYSNDDGICEITQKGGIPEPALLFTCKAARHEGIAVFYTVNSIRLVAESYHPAVHNLFLRKVASISKSIAHVKWLDVEIGTSGRRNFQNLTLWLQYVHSGKSLKPCPEDPQAPAEVEAEPNFVDSLFRIAAGMKDRPWADVERVVNGLRGGLIALNREWELDA